MAYLKIKGRDDKVVVSETQATQIKQIMTDDSIRSDKVLTIGDTVVRKRDVSWVGAEEGGVFIDRSEDVRKKLNDWYNQRRAFAALNNEEKANRMKDFWKIFVRGYSNAEDNWEIAKEKLVEYYRANPHAYYPNVKIWKAIPRPDNAVSMEANVNMAARRVIEFCISREAEDKTLAVY